MGYTIEGKKRKRQAVHQETTTKYHLALELIDAALVDGFQCSAVLFDSWYCVEPFLKELRKLYGSSSKRSFG